MKRRWWLLLVCGVLAGALGLSRSWGSYGWQQPAATLQVVGRLQQVTAADLQHSLADSLQSPWYRLEAEALRQTLLQEQPWLRDVQVRLLWLSTVQIRLQEHQAVARWGNDALLAEDGAVFQPPSIPARLQGLVTLYGNEDDRQRLREVQQQLLPLLENSPLQPQSLTLNERGEWMIRTQQGVQLRLGEGDPLAKIPLLQRVVAKLLTPNTEYVDLRYQNGFAIRAVPSGSPP